MSSDVTMRDFRGEDLEQVLALRARVFPAGDLARERRRWRWEFEENPFRVAGVPASWVLERGGRIVGNYGLVPVPFSIDGEIATCFNGIDFAVAPEEQGKGLGHRIIERHMDPALCPFPFLTGPTPPVAHLVASHGGIVIRSADEPCIWRLGLANAPGVPPPSGEVGLDEIDRFDARFDALFARVSRRHRVIGVRDRRYLDWRYRDYPFGRPRIAAATRRGGDLAGFFVLQHDQGKNIGYLLELFADPDDRDATPALIAGAAGAAREGGFAEIYALNRVEAVQRDFAAAGFVRVEGQASELACRLPRTRAGRPPIAAADVYWSPGDGDLLYVIGDLP
jgi:GNAT superfamily N-acetyltransferase